MRTIISISCAALAFSAHADVQLGELNGANQTWNRMSNSGAMISGFCSGVVAPDSVNDQVPYARLFVKATQPGAVLDVTVSSLEAQPLDFDPFLAVYCTSFDPMNPLVNLLHIDDDSAGYPNAIALGNIPLDTDQAYVVVISSYSNWAPSQYGAFKAELGPGLAFFNPCPADFTNDGTLNFFDVSAFLVAFNAQDPIADLNNDGFFNFFDVSSFLTSYQAGCP